MPPAPPAGHEGELVSVIIPTYRGDRFIAQALSSIHDQTWPHWEVIVVEDGSKGETETVVRRFASDHPSHRVEYLRHERNLNQSAARNTGIQQAKGKYIALLDVDDRWQCTHLEASLQALRQSQADLAYSTVAIFDDDSALIFNTCGPTNEALDKFPLSLFERQFITPSSVVFRKELTVDVGTFEPACAPCEDLDYWLRCAAKNKRFVLVPGCHVLYRKNHAEAQTRGIARMVETQARTLERHLGTWKDALPYHHKATVEMYFRAAWWHATGQRALDPTANPARAAELVWRGYQVHGRRVQYLLQRATIACCARLDVNLLRQSSRWLKPGRIMRLLARMLILRPRRDCTPPAPRQRSRSGSTVYRVADSQLNGSKA